MLTTQRPERLAVRYASLIAAYAIAASALGLAFLFPERPATAIDFAVVTAALTPITALFDFIGQGIIDSRWLKSMPPVIRPITIVVVLAALLGSIYIALKFVGAATVPW